MTSLNVHSEIGSLRKVLVHRPGAETQRYSHGEFLQTFPLRASYSSFDLSKAQAEHDHLVAILQDHGVEVVELVDLVAEALSANPTARERLIAAYLKDCRIEGGELTEAARAYLDASETEKQLTNRLLRGIRYSDTDLIAPECFPLAHKTGGSFDPETFLASPLSTAFFVRDPMNVIGSGVTLNHMYWHDRNREVDLFETLADLSPHFANAPQWFRHNSSFHLEGGDILNIDKKTIAVGLSERTEAAAIDVLCRELLSEYSESPIESVFVFTVPQIGNRLHLDTYLSRIDYDTFVVDPIFANEANAYHLSSNGGTPSVEVLDGSMADILSCMLGDGAVRLVELDTSQSTRMELEYSNGATGMLCLAPGNLCVCEENMLTNSILEKAGMTLHPTSIQELTVGFGGPGSLCLPLWRDDL